MELKSVEYAISASAWSNLPPPGPQALDEVAFVGRSNVGKSSLLNMIVGRKNLARTSGQPGKTRTFNFYLAEPRAENPKHAPPPPFYLVDLPGFGYAKVARTERERWGALMGRYLLEREPLRVAVHLVDSRHDPTALDHDVMQWMKASAKPYLIALTKADKLSKNQQQKSVATTKRVLRKIGLEVPVVLTSAAKKTGAEELLGWIDTLRSVDGR